jgi:hypothetical protein
MDDKRGHQCASIRRRAEGFDVAPCLQAGILSLLGLVAEPEPAGATTNGQAFVVG